MHHRTIGAFCQGASLIQLNPNAGCTLFRTFIKHHGNVTNANLRVKGLKALALGRASKQTTSPSTYMRGCVGACASAWAPGFAGVWVQGFARRQNTIEQKGRNHRLDI